MKLLCMDFGGSAIKYSVLDTTALDALSEKNSVPNTFETQEEWLRAVDSIVEQEQNAGKERIEGIAVSYCGELDHKTGMIYSPGAYRYNRNLNLKDYLEEKHHLPVSVENDGNAAMLAEWNYGELQGSENAAMIVIGTGIAASFIIDGKLHTGKSGFSGILSFAKASIRPQEGTTSLANMVSMNAGVGALLSAYLVEKGIYTQDELMPDTGMMPALQLDGKPFDGRVFFEKLASGDETAEKVLGEFAEGLANLLFNVHVVLEIERIAIGGGISMQPALIDAINRAMQETYNDEFIRYIQLPRPQICTAKFRNDANMIGAAIWFGELYGKMQ